MDEWLLKNLICPRDGGALRLDNNTLTCRAAHRYPIVDGIPVMLLNNVDQTLWVADESLKQANAPTEDNLYIETLGITEEEKESLREDVKYSRGVDPVANYMVSATSGYLYKPLIGKLSAYPIPELRLPQGHRQVFLDIGCNWGRWCIAACRRGYVPVGIDPSLGAVMAARRISNGLGVKALYVVGDARYLPFAPDVFDVVFSYSVLQHFSKENVGDALKEVARVLKAHGSSLIQMPNTYGVRCLFHQAKRRFREGKGFEVRYWRPSELETTFSHLIGPTTISVDGYFGLGIQASDMQLMPLKYKLIIYTSEVLRKLSLAIPFMNKFADSLYVHSKKNTGRKHELV